MWLAPWKKPTIETSVTEAAGASGWKQSAQTALGRSLAQPFQSAERPRSTRREQSEQRRRSSAPGR